LTNSATTIASPTDSATRSDSTDPSTLQPGTTLVSGGGQPGANTTSTTQAPTETAEETEAAAPPPLTTSQTAGIAVGGTTCLLIAVVAAIFLARRFHTAHGKRVSTGSVYPKVAYLYDPNVNGGGGGGDAEALMSGATEPKPQDGRAPQSMNHHPHHSIGNTRLSDSRDPFQDPVGTTRSSASSISAPADAVTALSAAVAGYSRSSRHRKYPSNGTNPFRSLVSPSLKSPPFSPDHVGTGFKRPLSLSSTRGEYVQLAVNPYAFPNPAATFYPPISPYNRPASQTSTHTSDSDPFADPFEHDILLHVDIRASSPDSVTVFASPPTPRTPRGPKPPVTSSTTSRQTLLSPIAAQYMLKPQQITITRKAAPRTPPTPSSEYTPNNTPPTPAHRGWDAIKRASKHFSSASVVPAPLNVSSVPATPALSIMSALPIKKKPVPLPATPRPVRALAVEIPRRASRAVNPVIAVQPADESIDPVVRLKRSGELEFADPELVGKSF
jgi:hypothetical protein